MSRAAQGLNMGAVSVLAGSWPVDVRCAVSWFPRFLERWIDRRQPKGIAVREALREDNVDIRAWPNRGGED
jgi:hypothetical protein